MLSVNDLIDINYIPTEEEISLKLLAEFYEEYLCKRIFVFTLKNGKVIKLFFRDGTEIFHVSGIDHIYVGVPMDGRRFLQGIKNKEIDLKVVENVNTAAYKDYVIRIRSMACLDTIIKNCEYLWYPEGKIPESKIEVKYLLLKGLDYDMVSKLSFADEDISAAIEMEEELRGKQEWMELLLGIFEEKLSDSKLVDKLLSLSIGEFRKYEKILADSIKREIRDGWKRSLKENLNINKVDIRHIIEKMDCYSSGRILSEVIKKYEKEELNSNMMIQIDKNITDMCEEIIHTVLINEICKNREEVLKKLTRLIADKI